MVIIKHLVQSHVVLCPPFATADFVNVGHHIVTPDLDKDILERKQIRDEGLAAAIRVVELFEHDERLHFVQLGKRRYLNVRAQ